MRTIITIMTFFTVLVACQSKTGKNTQNTVNDTINIKQSTENKYEKMNIDSIPNELKTFKERWMKEAEFKKLTELAEAEAQSDEEFSKILTNATRSSKITQQDIAENGNLYAWLMEQKYGLKPISDSLYKQRIRELFSIDITDKAYQPNKLKHYFNKFVVQSMANKSHGQIDNMPISEENWYGGLYTIDCMCFFKESKILLYKICGLHVIQSISDDNFVIDKATLKLQYHINNYVLHNSQASLTWLILNNKNQAVEGLHGQYLYGTEFLSELFYKFGYDKDPRINQFILKDIDLSSDYCDKDLFEGHLHIYADLFALKPFYGNTMKLRENLMKYVVDEVNENNCNLLKTLDYFGLSVCDGDKSTDAEEIAIDNYTQTERYKMAAYAGYYLYKGRQKLISANSALDSCYKNNFLTIELCGYKENELPKRYGSLFLDVNHMPRERSRNEDFIKALRDNNYYDLPGFKEIVEKIIGNE